jgi:hypothetical protein
MFERLRLGTRPFIGLDSGGWLGSEEDFPGQWGCLYLGRVVGAPGGRTFSSPA